MPIRRHAVALLSLSVLVALAGCSKDEKKAPSQVLARVNDAEITVLQLNDVMAGQQAATPAMQQRALDQLVDQEILVQKATELKLDRDPAVMQRIEQSRRQILATAAAERVIGRPQVPTDADVEAFYTKNPALFADRKIYDFVVFQLASKDVTPLTARLDASRTPDATKDILTQAGVKFDARGSRMPAEQLPLPLLSKVATLKTGDIAMMQDADKTTLLQMVNAVSAPVSAKDAAPAIKTYLGNQAAQGNAEQKLQALRKAAKIEFVKRFASEPAAVAPAATPADASAPSANETLKSGVKGLS